MPRIYVACLASYNAGTHHGKWIDIDGMDVDDIQTEINEILLSSPHPNTVCDCPECDGPASIQDMADSAYHYCEHCKGTGQVPTAEEWAIHDYDDIPDSFGENPVLESLVKYCEAYEEHGEPFRAWWENESDTDFDIDRFQEQYQGEWKSLADYVEDWWESTGDFKPAGKQWWHPSRYIDWEGMGNDLENSGDIWTTPGGDGIYVFSNL